MKTIIVDVPDETKAKLDLLRTRGYTINGFVRQALASALTHVQVPRRNQRRPS
jgi:hypothetical protein